MLVTRLSTKLVTPRYEDAGLFKAELCSVNVALLPGPRRTDRQDLVFDGLIDKTYRVPVFFAGRRAKMASVLERAARRVIAPEDDVPADPLRGPALRAPLSIRIDGAWRRLVGEDSQGFARVTHQFIAAAWTLGTGTGALMQFGMPPAR